VAEYVLPKFQLITSFPVYNTYKSGKILFDVEAKYTFGNAVKGTVTINQPERNKIMTFPINGKTTIELDLRIFLGITETTYTQNINFDITVLEELTGT
jgi:hypothetical protein